MTRVLFGALAVVDALLLLYLALNYGWLEYDLNENSISSPARWVDHPRRRAPESSNSSPDLPPFEESGDERMMRAFCEMARNGEGCRYQEACGS